MSEEDQKQRYGETTITSVSLSKEFKKLLDDHKISPTEAIRKGIAIELFEKGVTEYQTDFNKRRAEGIGEWIIAIDEFEIKKQELKEKTNILNKNIMENV